MLILSLMIIDAFMIMVCISYGRRNSREWQSVWCVIATLKVLFDVFVNRSVKAMVIQYAVPNLLSEDIVSIKKVLHSSSRRLLTKIPAFHLNRFSASDYIFPSVFIAKKFPHLVESKMVIMYKHAFPEPFVDTIYARLEHQKKFADNFFVRIFWAAAVPLFLY